MTPTFFSADHFLFLFFPLYQKNEKKSVRGKFNYFSYTIQIGGSNWYMDTGVRDLKIACFKASST